MLALRSTIDTQHWHDDGHSIGSPGGVVLRHASIQRSPDLGIAAAERAEETRRQTTLGRSATAREQDLLCPEQHPEGEVS